VALNVDRTADREDGTEASARMRHSWERNASAWTDAVRERRIASRNAGTDAAIIEAVQRMHPHGVLDVGCGEGWLARVLAGRGCRVVGIDASAALIDSARKLGGGTFEAMTYESLADRAAALGTPFDVVVCNFALLEQHLAPALHAFARMLDARGRLIVQTVHPWVACGEAPYVDGWRVETFAGFGDGFVEPMPWYFRTLQSWIDLLDGAGFRIDHIEEPLDPTSGRPLSLLMTATRVVEIG
jgi:2-polyprenyl-3-methyl-5-hydroxy-6-metoxy-1,4-benzoquinol methylase